MSSCIGCDYMRIFVGECYSRPYCDMPHVEDPCTRDCVRALHILILLAEYENRNVLYYGHQLARVGV